MSKLERAVLQPVTLFGQIIQILPKSTKAGSQTYSALLGHVICFQQNCNLTNDTEVIPRNIILYSISTHLSNKNRCFRWSPQHVSLMLKNHVFLFIYSVI